MIETSISNNNNNNNNNTKKSLEDTSCSITPHSCTEALSGSMGKEVICQFVASLFGIRNQVYSLQHESDTQDNRQQYFTVT